MTFSDCDGDGWLDRINRRSDEPIKNAEDQHAGWRLSAWLNVRD